MRSNGGWTPWRPLKQGSIHEASEGPGRLEVEVIVLPAIAVPVILLFSMGGAGLLILWAGGSRLQVVDLDLLFAAIAIGALLLGWMALMMAELGWFSLPHLAVAGGALLVISAAIGIARRRRGHVLRTAAGRSPFRRAEVVALGLWLIAALWLFGRPHEYITGAADVGVYLNLGAHIAHTGRIVFADSTLADLDPALRSAFLRLLPPGQGAPFYLFPGFYVVDPSQGLIVPEFYPLHPVWLAIGYGLGGLRAELWMTPFWGLLATFAAYMTARRLWGPWAGLLTLTGLSLTALQIWFARYATAEMLTQYLLWTGLWALVGWMDELEPRWLWPALAGGALGQVFLTRIDMYALLLWPIAIGLWRWRTKRWQRTDGLFFGLLAALVLHSLLHGLLLSRPYTTRLFLYAQRLILSRSGVLILAAVAGVVGGVATFVLAPRWQERARQAKFHQRWRWITAAAVGALACYGYWIRPRLGAASTYVYWYSGLEVPVLDHENLVRLGWYLSPVGIALGVAGIAWMLTRESNRRTMALLAVGLFFSFFYLWKIQANPHQVYAMRRYVPIVVPFLVLGAAYFLCRLWGAKRQVMRWLGFGLTLLWLCGIVVSARGFVSQVDMRGAVDQMRRLNNLFAPRSVLLFGDPALIGMGDLLGTPLRFLFGHDVYAVRDLGALQAGDLDGAVARWQASGRAVYWISVPRGLPWPGRAPLEDAREFTFEAAVLENTYTHKPYRVEVSPWPITIARVMGSP